MAKNVFVCLKCKNQSENGFCKECGPTQTQDLDSFSRIKDGTIERELKDRYKEHFPEMKAREISTLVAQDIKKLK